MALPEYKTSINYEDSDKGFLWLFTGFTAIGDSKYTSDVNWGCMLRSSQMLVAQVFCCVNFVFVVSSV